MHVTHDAPLAPLTTLGLGGPAATLVELTDPGDFTEFVAFVEAGAERGRPPVSLGAGSNALVHDDGCSAPVLRMATHGIRRRDRSGEERVLLEVQAGHSLSDLVATTVGEGLTGMEMLTGIPGTVGATPIQNVGAYGQEVSDTLVAVRAWDWQARRRVTIPAAACGLGHRTSRFKGTRRWTVLSLVFALRRSALSAPIGYRQVAAELDVDLGARVPLAEAARAVHAVRRGKGMLLECAHPGERSVGSVFLSPAISPARATELRARNAPVNSFPDGSTRVSASWLIREAGFGPGRPVAPGVRVSSLHYTLVAEEPVGSATAAGFAAAVEIVRRRVHRHTGVQLTAEIDYLGDWEQHSAGKEASLPFSDASHDGSVTLRIKG
ncbi:UDP-N-acetylmuramate dehydrogenase [Streptomyces silaceus]|uniref:UDP-N-acetylmuramate dehydrogenase n=1 Tax=Streptomyces silaceus TaxID=545123 RepID=UPI0006EB90DD|nr:UDP-N-acetylmuramate dehydrogenase [Streptomyces silaceus]